MTRARLEKERALRMQEKTWQEDKNKLEREKRSLQRKLDDLPGAIAQATRDLQAQCDATVFEERRKAAKNIEQCQEEYEKLRDDMNGQVKGLATFKS